MSRFGVQTLNEIAEQVWDDLHDKDSSKRKAWYNLDITSDELYIVCHALLRLRESMKGKAEQHAYRTHPQLLKDIKSLQKKLIEHDFIDEGYEDMAKIHSAVKQSKTHSAKKQAKQIADYVEKELLEIGTSAKSAKEIRSFIKDAMIAITMREKSYEKKLNTLATIFTF